MMSAERSLANTQHHHGAVVSEDLATAEECGRHKTAAGLHIATTLTEPPAHVDMALGHIWAACESLAALLNAILAKIECDDIAHEARAPPTTTLPHPAAMLSTPPAL
jgi:hypothetical protein